MRKMMIDVNRLTFGVELETVMRQSTLNDFGVTVGSYTSTRGCEVLPCFVDSGGMARRWIAKSDGSICTGSNEDEDDSLEGVEWVSPILQGRAGLENLDKVCAKLRSMRAVVNNSCGCHIHIGGMPEDLTCLRRLFCLFARYELGMFAATGSPRRRTNQYTVGIKKWQRPLDAKGVFNTKRSMQNTLGGARYLALNALPFLTMPERPTIEFRLFGGTTNSNKVQSWVMLCLSMMERAINTTTSEVWRMEQVEQSPTLATAELLTRLWGTPRWGKMGPSIYMPGAVSAREFTLTDAKVTLMRQAELYAQRSAGQTLDNNSTESEARF